MSFELGDAVRFTEREAPQDDTEDLGMVVVELTSTLRTRVEFPSGLTSYYRTSMLEKVI